ncbi:interleukin-17 receptor A-like [Brienomyrus brachyistius]|uniref:interleukin-17 receptor A-like n=1 Tax=Brienomyrus brachyistius TaxID=42636 RepID=UPI0020B36D45|nr:interleukin-17 receptor A-like [Brienomyrus brachyistius]
MKFPYTTFLLSTQIVLLSGLRILRGPPPNCTQEGLGCRANINNCLDKDWLKPNDFTPTGPDQLQVTIEVREEDGKQVPVLMVKWKARSDGSIKFLNGTEVHVLKMSSNQNFCVRYIFLNAINSMKNAYSENWSFSLDSLVVDPGQMYLVTVSNLPKPNMGHDIYNTSKDIVVPGCQDRMMKRTYVCSESGSLWKSNIDLRRSGVAGENDAIAVYFNGEESSVKYKVSVQCSGQTNSETVSQNDLKRMNVTFQLGKWPRTCCEFSVEIQPFFHRCRNDCVRHQKKISICTENKKPLIWPVIVGVSLALGVLCCIAMYFWVRKPRKGVPREVLVEDLTITPNIPDKQKTSSNGPRRVLVIYSLDHTLYKDIVLKLSAFLRAKCGTDVVLDMLDTAELGTVGRMQWLDSQKQQMEKSSDKILILCSRGVQAKWNAMCTRQRVMLKEDVRSPTGDMLTPAFSLIIPDLLHPAAFGKYIVAYFDDVSSEDDVPPPFNITVKYKLMKHFEELYFRILDKEKYEPGKVNRIEGIAQDEYFSCPSGRALRDAIEAFEAYQLEHPDWFEKECVDSEEDALDTDLQCPLLVETQNSSVLQCVPDCKEGPPVLVNTVQVSEEGMGIFQFTPIMNESEGKIFTQHVNSAHPELNQVYSFYPSAQLDHSQEYAAQPAVDDDMRVYRAEIHPMVCQDAAIQELFPQSHTWHQGRPASLPEETDENQSPSSSSLSDEMLRTQIAVQQSLGPRNSQTSYSEEEEFLPGAASDWMQAEYALKRPLSDSDQGYISRTSPQQDSSLREDFQDHREELLKLQNTCLSLSLKPQGHPFGPQNNPEEYESDEDL